MPLIPNECAFVAVSGGLADFVVSTHFGGFFTPDECTAPPIVDGGVYFWRAQSLDLLQHEFFEGAYNQSTKTTARTVIQQSSNGGAKVNFTLPPIVRIVAPSQVLGDSENLVSLTVDTVLTAADTSKTLTNTGASGDIVVTLPPAERNLKFGFLVDAAHKIKIKTVIETQYTTGDSIAVGVNKYNPAFGHTASSDTRIAFPGAGGGLGACSADGTKQLYGGGNFAAVSADSGDSWIASSSFGEFIQDVAMGGSNGQILFVLGDTHVHISTNLGFSWSTVAVGANNSSIACSDDGSYVVITTYDGGTWVSSNSGASWAQTANIYAFVGGECMDCNTTGQKLILADYANNGGPWLSNDGGVTWAVSPGTVTGYVQGVHSSDDGQKLSYSDNSGSIYFSSNRGASWTASPGTAGGSWSVMSPRPKGANGATVAICLYNPPGVADYYYFSTDYGATWTGDPLFPAAGYFGVTISTDGVTRLAGTFSPGAAIHQEFLIPTVPDTPLLIESNAPSSYFQIEGVDALLWAATDITGTWSKSEPTPVVGLFGQSSSPIITDTIKNILLLVPTDGLVAWASDIGQFLVADGTQWQINSSYTTAIPTSGNPDIGEAQWSNRVGSGKDFITDKIIANCRIGFGSDPGSFDGQIRYNPAIGTFGQFQRYSTITATWRSIVEGLVLTEALDMSQAITQTPIGKAEAIIVFNGNSVVVGLNGIPLVQGYKVNIGAYPVPQIVSGGTF